MKDAVGRKDNDALKSMLSQGKIWPIAPQTVICILDRAHINYRVRATVLTPGFDVGNPPPIPGIQLGAQPPVPVWIDDRLLVSVE